MGKKAEARKAREAEKRKRLETRRTKYNQIAQSAKPKAPECPIQRQVQIALAQGHAPIIRESAGLSTDDLQNFVSNNDIGNGTIQRVRQILSDFDFSELLEDNTTSPTPAT